MSLWIWKNFTPYEIACRHCGEVKINEYFLGALQRNRDLLGSPLSVSSVYRCPIWNAMVGGAPLSTHKLGRAADQSGKNTDAKHTYELALEAGFTGFGFYRTFTHTDTGRARIWGKKSWLS
jgi:uncharacterized protein YcbK (DUF882 family)